MEKSVFECIEQRRAVKSFDPQGKVPQAHLETLFQMVQLTPSSFNLQHWRLLVVEDNSLRQKIQAVSWNQAQVTQASCLFLVCADVQAWKKSPEQYWAHGGEEKKALYGNMIQNFYGGKEQLMRDEAIRSASMASQTLMLAAQGLGYDTCPMIGFDADAVAKLVNLPEDYVIGMMIAMGKPAAPAHPRGSLLGKEAIVFYNEFPDSVSS